MKDNFKILLATLISINLGCSSSDSNPSTQPDPFVFVPGELDLVTQSTSGVRSFGGPGADVSGNGRFVVFWSDATNLVAGDTNSTRDIFVRDLDQNTTTRVNTDENGNQVIDGLSYQPTISSDGRFVAFVSSSSNLVPNDTNNNFDIFVKNLQTGGIVRASVATNGTQANSASFSLPSLSEDGRYVVFTSIASNLVASDTNGNQDAFVRDLLLNTTLRISTDFNGNQSNGDTRNTDISLDGRYVVMTSAATNLVTGDTNGFDDIFVKDLQTAEIQRVSVSSTGQQPSNISYEPRISGNGRYVSFGSSARDLVSSGSPTEAGSGGIYIRDLQTSTTIIGSVRSNGSAINGSVSKGVLSDDGRFLFFVSSVNNLVASDTNGHSDCFLKDLQTGLIKIISVNSSGGQGNNDCYLEGLSGDGSSAVFSSEATNLIENDTNGFHDIFLKRL